MILNTSEINGIIFDIDGTILDSMPIWENAGSIFLKNIGIEPDSDLGSVLFSMTFNEGAAYIRERYCPDMTVEAIKSGISNVISNFYENEVVAKPGAVELITAFANRGIPMALATTGDDILVRKALTRLGIMKHFKAVFNCNDLNMSKDKPEIFFLAAEKIKNADEELKEALKKIFVLEDSLTAVRTSKNAGFKTIAVYDEASRAMWDELKREAYLYVSTLSDIELQ